VSLPEDVVVHAVNRSTAKVKKHKDEKKRKSDQKIQRDDSHQWRLVISDDEDEETDNDDKDPDHDFSDEEVIEWYLFEPLAGEIQTCPKKADVVVPTPAQPNEGSKGVGSRTPARGG
jgi:hypothetical protein